jgi:hypothetical protein
MAEGGYEEAPHTGPPWTPLNCRKQGWWSYLSGGHHSYGHHGNWTSAATWREWIDSPGARQMTVCRDVLTSLPGWWELVPDQGLIVSGEGAGDEQNVAARSASGDWAIVYFAGAGAVGIDQGGRTASWIDPRTGERSEAKSIAGTFSPPDGWEDALLLLE